ncbi:MAG: 23S rRNA (adenine(2030)-N(6))-methyltransferase RlmJ [Spirochaetales bacterium]|nr:23S rRNA (adenine(2030)-N(6))-methyltransferase RlmJ [Spirochaetales bacterium]
MLSYRHGFHAGNHADVLKHAVVSCILARFSGKKKPFSYVESHAGGGEYTLDSEWAEKTGEAERGIIPLLSEQEYPPVLQDYLDLCRSYWKSGKRYPGSPALARELTDSSVHLTLMEKHPAEAEHLRQLFGKDKRIHIHERDGFSGLIALTPPDPIRGLALIDPSYETHADWTQAAETFLQVRRRWAAGTLALWYPLLDRRQREIELLVNTISYSGFPSILHVQCRVPAPEAEQGFGLKGSAMIVINPPWKLDEDITAFLPWLGKYLASGLDNPTSLTWLSPN